MKIWKGLEQEGVDVGKETYFVQSSCIRLDDLYIIEKLPDNSRIYLGAGRVELLLVEDIDKFIDIIQYKKFTVIQETSDIRYILPKLSKYINKIVYSVRQSLISNLYINDISFKLDRFTDYVLLEKEGITKRTLEDLNDGMYENIDTVVFDNYKK